MLMTSARRAFRLVALALAAVHLVVSAGAPMYEASTVASHMGSSVSVAAPDSGKGLGVHDPGTCPACLTLGAFARLPDASRLLLQFGDAGAASDSTVDPAPQVGARHGFLSRAPPTLLG